MENELTLLDDALSYYERLHIERVLRENQMNREKTALALGVSLRTLYYKLKKLNIQF
jgi:transcriptional regulator with PAS, ATPase and Fis domain